MKKSKTVDEYILNHADQRDAITLLRSIVTSFPFQETIKWLFPVYMINGKNVIGLGSFKAYTGIWFFQGGLLKDSQNKLVNAQEGKTQAMRQWRFNSISEIQENEELIRAYIDEAIENQKAGREIKPMPRTSKPLIIPKELQSVLDTDNSLKESFESHSLTNKRDFAEYIETAKREETKQKRLEKIIPMIQSGEGLNDKYKR